MFEVKINTGNAAFHDYNEEYDNYAMRTEVIRILQKVIHSIDAGYNEGSCIDINGNKVGSWNFGSK